MKLLETFIHFSHNITLKELRFSETFLRFLRIKKWTNLHQKFYVGNDFHSGGVPGSLIAIWNDRIRNFLNISSAHNALIRRI